MTGSRVLVKIVSVREVVRVGLEEMNVYVEVRERILWRSMVKVVVVL